MDFTEYKCPVCEKQFAKGDDIVVCPECGAPHHRECYEEVGHCFYEDKHSDDFSFEELNNDNDSEDNDSDTIVCPRCKAVNPKEIFYCQQCGLPLGKQDNNNQNYNQYNQQNQQPFGQQPFGQGGMPFGAGFNYDPMAGLNNNEPIAEDVTAGEMSKFVGKNTPYFLTVFNRINKTGTSKYNFAAFIFSGMYFLYRKMIGLGIIVSIVTIGLMVGSYYVLTMPAYQEAYSIVAQTSYNSMFSLFYTDTSVLSFEQLIIFNLPFVLNILMFAFRLLFGAIANRCYYKHCSKKIRAIKSKEETSNINQQLESKGGVNLPLAICVGVIYLAVNYLPFFMV